MPDQHVHEWSTTSAYPNSICIHCEMSLTDWQEQRIAELEAENKALRQALLEPRSQEPASYGPLYGFRNEAWHLGTRESGA